MQRTPPLFVARARAFSLVELLMVLTILGVLAAVAVPKFFDYSDQSKEAATRAILGNVRSGIANFRANEALTNGEARYPTIKEIRKIGTVMDEAMPSNPYSGHKNADQIGDANKQWKKNKPPVNGSQGWRYDPKNGKFWANSKTAGENKW